MTPTEIIKAEGLGAGFIKIFPGNILGPGYISSIRDIFPNLTFMVTGGVEPQADNLRGWFGAGVSAVGLGSKLLSREAVESGDYETLVALTREALQTTKSIRHEK
jgi:2-dehydro-3-deoxyphosphogluconate aldolase / (4S)-4-hydroxy-2-oxoglutarate aldolase